MLPSGQGGRFERNEGRIYHTPSCMSNSTRFYLVLANEDKCWSLSVGGHAATFLFRCFLPVIGSKQRFRGRLHAQSIEVSHFTRWRSGDGEGTLAGVPIMTFAL
jgi:hypothetical protein